MKLRARVQRARFRVHAFRALVFECSYVIDRPHLPPPPPPHLNSFCNIFAELPIHEIVGNSQTEKNLYNRQPILESRKKTFLKYLEVNLLLQLFKASLYEKL